SMACGEFGPGRMSDPAAIYAAIEQMLARDTMIPLPPDVPGLRQTTGLLAGRRVVVTSGPTREPIDPVRYISNRSSGKQGHAIAAAAAGAGAEVILISRPVTLADPMGVTTIHIETARDMLSEVEAALPADIFIGVAAVADWRAAEVSSSKVKKNSNQAHSLALVENPDILAAVGRRADGRPSLVVGFAAETEMLVENARAKLAAKNCDMIIANLVGEGVDVLGGENNEVLVLTRQGQEAWPRLTKAEIAGRVVARLAGMLPCGGR